MRILILTQYIYPETFRSSDMAFELAKRGHTVDVLTGIPNYPGGRYFNGYGIFRKRIETVSGVKFYRCFQTPRKLLPSNLGLSLNYISFVACASLWVLFFFSLKKKYDIILTHEPSPITQILPAILLKKIRKIPVFSWIMDIWPDSVTDSLGPNYRNLIIPPLQKITDYVYKNSDLLLITSPGFKRLINRSGNYTQKIKYFPNWSIDYSKVNSFFHIPTLPKGFIIMIAGNLGEAQNLDAVADAILELKEETELKWVFVGNGSKKQWLEDFAIKNGLTKTIYMLGQFPQETMPYFFKQANAMLVSLSPGYDFLDVTIPARLQSYMSAGRPILGMVGSGGAEIIKESNCGYTIAPGCSHELAKVIKERVLKDKSGFENKGINGRKYYENHFQLELCINNLENMIHNYLNNKPS